MKPLKILSIILLCSCFAYGQQDMPSCKLLGLDGETYEVMGDFSVPDRLYVISFWATWCAPCIVELEELNDVYEEWIKQVDFTLIAVSVDDARTEMRVNSFVKGKGWPFIILKDTNQELKRRLGINDVPHVLIVKNKKIIYAHTGYTAGDEIELLETLKKYKS
ncbi:MAG: TlpA family protein disulfide reductase [Cyclobacteriaceae bacterium]|nr:TlpA family protein disulfide reductase [Cyclobacteriaceae bacterium]